MENQNVEKVMDLDKLEGVEGGESVDLEQFDKKEVEIESVTIVQVPSEYTETKKQWVLKVQSVILTSIGEGENKVDFRASELFNLIQDKEGKLIGFPKAEGSNLAKFMKDLKVSKPSELKGKKALVKSYEKGNRTYLKFRY